MQTPFSFLWTVVFFHQRTACSFLIVLLLDWAKGLWYYQSIALLGWPLPPTGNSTSPKLRGLEVMSLRDSPRSSTHEGVPRWRHHKFYALHATSYRCTYKSQKFFFGSQVTCFGRDPSHPIKTPRWIFTRRSTGKGGTGNGLLIAFLEESRKSTSSVSTSRLHSDSSSGAEASGSQKNKMTARNWAISPDSRVSHPLRF